MSTVVSVVTQRRRNRQFVAMHVAPKNARPQALRDLYRDYGTVIRHADRDSSNESDSATPQTSR